MWCLISLVGSGSDGSVILIDEEGTLGVLIQVPDPMTHRRDLKDDDVSHGKRR